MKKPQQLNMKKEQIVKLVPGRKHTMKTCTRKKYNMKIKQHGKNTNYSKCGREIDHHQVKQEKHEKSTTSVSEIWKSP